MQLQVLGIGDAFTSKYFHTCFLIESSKTFLVDGSAGLFRLLKARGREPDEIDGVIVTHCHGDHVSGVATFILWNKHFRDMKTPLFTSRNVFEELRSAFFPAFSQRFTSDLKSIKRDQFEDYVEFHELKEEGLTDLDSETRVKIRHNWHPVATLGLKIISADWTLGLSGDTCFRPTLLEALLEQGVIPRKRYEKLAGPWLWDSDLIYHEATRSKSSPHTHESDLLALPEPIRRKIRLVHVSDSFEPASLPVAQEGETAYFQTGTGVQVRN